MYQEVNIIINMYTYTLTINKILFTYDCMRKINYFRKKK